MSLYSDKHTTYKSTAKPTIEDELNGENHHMSQFERAMKELEVEVIHTHDFKYGKKAKELKSSIP